jgi:glycerophosphoryl diester phosphodiesterase
MESTFSKISTMGKTVFLLLLFITIGSSACYAQDAGVRLFAHRAGAHELDENTMEAFKTTYSKGIRGFETDVRRTKDGKLVIFHDDSFERMLGIQGKIEDLSLAEIKKLRTKKGNPIPTLDEVVAFFKDKPGVYIEFEMKTNKPMYGEAELQTYCAELYKKTYENKPEGSDYVLTSFDKRPLQYLKSTYPNVDLLFIKGVALTQSLVDEAKAMGINRIGANVHATTRNMVIDAKKQGITVSLWPGRSVNDFLLGVYLGSDYLCSDVPIAVTEWVKANAPQIKLK